MAISLFSNDKVAYIFESASVLTQSLMRQVEAELRLQVQHVSSLDLEDVHTNPELEEASRNRFEKYDDLFYVAVLEDGRQAFNLSKDFVPSEQLLTKLTRSEGEKMSIHNIGRDQLLVSLEATSLNQKRFHTVFGFSLNKLSHLFEESQSYQNYLVDETGKVVLGRERDFSKWSLFTKDDTAGLSNLTMEVRAPDTQQAFLLATTVVPGTPLKIVSMVPKAKAMAASNVLLWKSLIFLALILSMAVALSIFASSKLTSPLRLLAAATDDIAAGNYSVEIPVKTNDEVGYLTAAFKNLGKRLSEREKELQDVTELAITDGMTGLFNHRHFQNRLREFFQLATRNKEHLSLLLMDVDHFKKIQ